MERSVIRRSPAKSKRRVAPSATAPATARPASDSLSRSCGGSAIEQDASGRSSPRRIRRQPAAAVLLAPVSRKRRRFSFSSEPHNRRFWTRQRGQGHSDAASRLRRLTYESETTNSRASASGSSCPGLSRASTSFRSHSKTRTWMAGQGAAMTESEFSFARAPKMLVASFGQTLRTNIRSCPT